METEKIFFIAIGVFTIVVVGSSAAISLSFGETFSIMDICAIVMLLAMGVISILAGIFEKY